MEREEPAALISTRVIGAAREAKEGHPAVISGPRKTRRRSDTDGLIEEEADDDLALRDRAILS